MKKPALFLKASSSGRREEIAAVRLAWSRTPSTPVTRSPRRAAMLLPSRSSKSTTSAPISNARAIASASPECKPEASNRMIRPCPTAWIRIQPSRIACSISAPAEGWGMFSSSLATASGTNTSRNCARSKSRRPIAARFETGDVLLTTRIREVLRQVFVAVVPRNASLRDQFAEKNPGYFREFRRLAERKGALRIERDPQLRPQPRRDLRFGQTEALDDRVRDPQRDTHDLTVPRFH